MMSKQAVALVTGGTKGIGRACVDRLISQGYQVVTVARNLPADPMTAECIAVDLTDRAAFEVVLADITQRYEVTTLVNNAGATGMETIETLTEADFDREIQLNLFSAFQATRAVVPGMKAAGFGRIVNIASELVLGYPQRSSYGASKAGMISASRTWALELGPHGVTSNTIAPGPIATDFFNQKNPDGSPQRIAKMAKIPVGHFGVPDDIARTVAFLVDPAAGYITGQTIFVDGGSSIGAGALL